MLPRAAHSRSDYSRCGTGGYYRGAGDPLNKIRPSTDVSVAASRTREDIPRSQLRNASIRSASIVYGNRFTISGSAASCSHVNTTTTRGVM